jgi:hypothetical protein
MAVGGKVDLTISRALYYLVPPWFRDASRHYMDNSATPLDLRLSVYLCHYRISQK